MKKTTKTTVKKYDGKGNILEHTETIVEEEIKEDYTPYIPPMAPSITPNPYPIAPQVGDYPTSIYTNTGIGKDLTVTFDANKDK